ncbi:MAG: PorP/SprF family type IX secretion system membrane protein [Bacteroidota bacterium]
MRQILVFFLTFFYLTNSFSQNEIIINQYSQNIFALSSSYSSLSGQPEANLYYKKLWSGFADSPEFSQITVSSPLKGKKLGLGLNTTYQQVGLFSYLNAQISCSYKIKLNDINFLSFGLQGGIKRLQVNFSKINAYDADEFIDYPRLQASTLPTADFSVAYKRKNFLAFASANQLLSGKFKYNDATYQPNLSSQVVPYYIVGVKWDKAINTNFNNTATLIYRSHQGLPFQIEVSDIVTWRNKIAFGLGYRQTYTTYALARFQVTPYLLVGYSYDYNVNKMNTYTKGGHEINLSLKFGNTKNTDSQKRSSGKDVTELYEQLDLMNQKLEQSNKRVDSLDKNVMALRDELNRIKQQGLNQEEIKRLIDSIKVTGGPATGNNTTKNTDKTTNSSKNDKYKNEFKGNGKKRYGSIKNEQDGSQYEGVTNAKYCVVLGIYKIFKYSKEYQKILLRDHKIDTELIQLENAENNYYYVVEKKSYTNLKEALTKLYETRKDLDARAEKITNGQPWVLVTLEN